MRAERSLSKIPFHMKDKGIPSLPDIILPGKARSLRSVLYAAHMFEMLLSGTY